jgi:hypothetical protein
MKNLFFFVQLSILCLSVGCQKDPKEAILPNEVVFGASVVYLNGEEAAYLPSFRFDTFNRVMNYTFVESKNQALDIALVGFGLLPFSLGEFDISADGELYKKAQTVFVQVLSGDLEGYSYKLVDADEGFIHVEHLDSIQQEVRGRFRAKFKRTSKNGNEDLGLPKIIVFQGVFNEKYIRG